ncbi:MAG: thiamine pyrophosphate-dependent dehydrogenase E1 component subunit alpha [Proteobacteria bacterium]|nr:thiamine pyrophosphate-dependent dehydrogenase E1 component subunit alpha [Pseudomonadota bacterium]MBU2228412.1 thiamine pyrophosphate-dependent dehydrogenase E1 component subunit alpha [Pseudomonadota bacterium]MBU2261091.1 thiamine pyrophosphate-dependent dehydrogenase E1 component subunit alpha [Pseudomonadota bacterium]
MKLSKDKQLALYTTMKTIRLFEERISDLYARGQIPGLVHLYIGEEAVAAGVCAALREDDYITSTHRGHGHVIAKGAELNPMMAELYGKKTGYCKGKGGSMHIADMTVGILGANGIAGGGLPIAVGAGWSAKWRGTDQVAVCFFGDGSSNNGTFHESLNLASVHRLPVIFVCENNLYGISVCQAKHQAITDVAVRATAYDMPGVVVDGNDVTAVFQAAEKAVKRARAGEGPTLVECKTYRWRGHHEGDPNQGARYRTREEIDVWKNKCPIERFARQMVSNRTATAKKIEAIDREITGRIDAAVAYAETSEFPAYEEMFEDVYV